MCSMSQWWISALLERNGMDERSAVDRNESDVTRNSSDVERNWGVRADVGHSIYRLATLATRATKVFYGSYV